MLLPPIGRLLAALVFVAAASLTPGLSTAPAAASSGLPAPTAVSLPTPVLNATWTPPPTSGAYATTPADTQVFEFDGRGSDHGVGMSQYGAYGRALAGQTYPQILGAYFSGTSIGRISPKTRVRVLLAASHVPTPESPARITARNGPWSSTAFVDALGRPRVFPRATYVQLVHGGDGWLAQVYSPTGVLLQERPATDLTIRPASKTTLLEIKWRDYGMKYNLVRGSMRLLVKGAGVEAINNLSMDDYLRAVVPAEMPAVWPIEALRAQAVAARSYAYLRLKPRNAFDVKPTSANQVYAGWKRERPKTNLAVSSTSNQVVSYNGRVANALFFATGGGATENNEYVWNVTDTGRVTAKPVAYLRGVSDVGPNGVAYDSMAPDYSWTTAQFSWAQLDEILNSDPRTAVGKLEDVKFDRGFSGRIYRATIVGAERTTRVSASIFRAVFNKHRPAGHALKSMMFWLRPVAQ